MTTTEREAMLALAKRADDCLNSRSSAYPSDVLRECVAALRLAASPPTAGSDVLREALQPFAAIADLYADQEDDTFRIFADMDLDAIGKLTLGACRKARAALAPPSETGREAKSEWCEKCERYHCFRADSYLAAQPETASNVLEGTDNG